MDLRGRQAGGTEVEPADVGAFGDAEAHLGQVRFEELIQIAGTGAPPERAQAIRALRNAALSDASGKALDKALREHGAPPRPVVAQPIRWVRKRPGVKSAGVG